MALVSITEGTRPRDQEGVSERIPHAARSFTSKSGDFIYREYVCPTSKALALDDVTARDRHWTVLRPLRKKRKNPGILSLRTFCLQCRLKAVLFRDRRYNPEVAASLWHEPEKERKKESQLGRGLFHRPYLG